MGHCCRIPTEHERKKKKERQKEKLPLHPGFNLNFGLLKRDGVQTTSTIDHPASPDITSPLEYIHSKRAQLVVEFYFLLKDSKPSVEYCQNKCRAREIRCRANCNTFTQTDTTA